MSTFDKKKDDQIRDAGTRLPPIKDAATLVLVRRERGVPHVLMGQRAQGTRFMPNKFVFPGGRVDPGDHRIAPLADLNPDTCAKVMADPRGARSVSETKAKAIALAALRETFEETGLVLGEKTAALPKTRSPGWQRYFETGVAPRLDGLVLVARAITPPYRPKRYDARFFMADADLIAADAHDMFDGSGELLELHWVPLDEATKLDLPNITRAVLGRIAERTADGKPFRPTIEAPFFHFVRGKPQMVHV